MLLFATPVVVLLLAAAVTDVRSRTIPNAIPAGIAILFFAAAIALPEVEWLAATGVAIAVFLAGAALFATGKFGGGDVKLLAAGALWAGVTGVFPFLVITAVVGGLLGILKLMQNFLDYFRALVWPNGRASDFSDRTLPYGVAIAAGGIFTLATQIFPI